MTYSIANPHGASSRERPIRTDGDELKVTDSDR